MTKRPPIKPEDWTILSVSKKLKERIKKLGTLGDTYDSLLTRILDEWEAEQ